MPVCMQACMRAHVCVCMCVGVCGWRVGAHACVGEWFVLCTCFGSVLVCNVQWFLSWLLDKWR